MLCNTILLLYVLNIRTLLQQRRIGWIREESMPDCSIYLWKEEKWVWHGMVAYSALTTLHRRAAVCCYKQGIKESAMVSNNLSHGKPSWPRWSWRCATVSYFQNSSLDYRRQHVVLFITEGKTKSMGKQACCCISGLARMCNLCSVQYFKDSLVGKTIKKDIPIRVWRHSVLFIEGR